MQWVRSLISYLRPARRLVGTDLDGNKYFELLSRTRRPRREMVTKLKHEQYVDGTIPLEWESWIRGRREEPPTHNELLKKIQQKSVLKEKVQKLEEEDLERRAKEQGENIKSLQARPVGHASSPVYENLDLQSEPTRTGNVFRPGSWKPGGETNHEGNAQADDESFKAEAWSPGKKSN